jgi:hypothetical protein
MSSAYQCSLKLPGVILWCSEGDRAFRGASFFIDEKIPAAQKLQR